MCSNVAGCQVSFPLFVVYEMGVDLCKDSSLHKLVINEGKIFFQNIKWRL